VPPDVGANEQNASLIFRNAPLGSACHWLGIFSETSLSTAPWQSKEPSLMQNEHAASHLAWIFMSVSRVVPGLALAGNVTVCIRWCTRPAGESVASLDHPMTAGPTTFCQQ
jgi:hypothetical protein